MDHGDVLGSEDDYDEEDEESESSGRNAASKIKKHSRVNGKCDKNMKAMSSQLAIGIYIYIYIFVSKIHSLYDSYFTLLTSKLTNT